MSQMKNKKSPLAINKEMLKPIIKDVLEETDTLKEAINESKIMNISSSPPEILCLDSTFVDAVVEKLAVILIANEKLNSILSTNIATIVESKSSNLAEQAKRFEKSMSRLKEENHKLMTQQEKLAQYSRHKCLIIHGIPYTERENTDKKSCGLR